MKKSVLLSVVVFMLLATPVMAKEGFYVGAYALPKTEVSITGIDEGSGYGFRAGLGFNRYLAIEGSYEKAEQDMTNGSEADLNGWAADLKINFPLTSLDRHEVMTLEPFIRLGYGDYELEVPNQKPTSGNGLRFGAGIELYLFKELSISGGWTRTKVSFDTPFTKTDARIKIIDVGLNYHFM
jgi:hypothetical protein